MRHFKTISLVLTLLLVIAVGCSKKAPTTNTTSTDSSDTAVSLVNTVCPIAGNPASSDVSVEWNGKQVGFCCADCIPAWNKLSDEEKTAKLAADEAPPTDAS